MAAEVLDPGFVFRQGAVPQVAMLFEPTWECVQRALISTLKLAVRASQKRGPKTAAQTICNPAKILPAIVRSQTNYPTSHITLRKKTWTRAS